MESSSSQEEACGESFVQLMTEPSVKTNLSMITQASRMVDILKRIGVRFPTKKSEPKIVVDQNETKLDTFTGDQLIVEIPYHVQLDPISTMFKCSSNLWKNIANLYKLKELFTTNLLQLFTIQRPVRKRTYEQLL